MSIRFLLFLTATAASNLAHAQLSDTAINRLLKKVNGSVTFSQQHYDGVNLVSQHAFQNQELHTDDGVWQLQLKVMPVAGNNEAVDVAADFRLREGKAPSSAVDISFNFSKWSAANYLLVPAIVYNGNRYRTIGESYSPAYPRDMYYNPAVPLTISNNPRLSVEPGQSSLIALETGNMATPAVCFFSPTERKGFIMLTEQRTKWGNSGITITENAGKDNFGFRISAPAVRKLAAGFGDFHPSGDKAADWNAGDEVTLRCRIYVFEAADIPALLTKFMKVRKDISGPSNSRNLLPMSKLLELGTAICSKNFTQEAVGSYYKPENNNDFQLGWVSGMINTYPMLSLNNEVERKRVSDELDFVVHKLQGKSGYFFGAVKANGTLITEKGHPDFPEMQAMVRKNADDLFWMVKHLMLFKESGYAGMIHPEWEAAAQKLAVAFTATWKKHHEFGQYIAPETGEIAVFNSTAGALVPGGLALAAHYFNKPEWLKAAGEAAAFYYHRDVVKQGFTGGDCGDISQDANSESAFGFLESLMALYTYTGDHQWLQMAEVQAALCATWTMSYAPVFPPRSTIGKLQCNMTGAVWASIQNKHAAPGICTASGDDLFKLFRATGNTLYADLIHDIQHAHAEAVNMPGHITSNYLIGSSMERIQASDAEGKESVGNFIYTRNSWTETNGMLMALELPGIYVVTDKASMYVFDHIEATLLKKNKNDLEIALHNPTAYDANVAVMAETSGEALKPLGYTSFLKWKKVPVKAGQRVKVIIKGKELQWKPLP